jgi:hypothetical protein
MQEEAIKASAAAAMLLAMAWAQEAGAQTMAARRVYVDFNQFSGDLQVDNGLQGLIGLSQNGALQLTFQAVFDTVASDGATINGPVGATLELAQRPDVANPFL